MCHSRLVDNCPCNHSADTDQADHVYFVHRQFYRTYTSWKYLHFQGFIIAIVHLSKQVWHILIWCLMVSLHGNCNFSFKLLFFSSQNKHIFPQNDPNNLDPSCKMDPDYLGHFLGKIPISKPIFMTIEMETHQSMTG